ncbi:MULTISPECIES: hypothetical protein [unclassified Nonomuraea]|uniref:hypothetical protein n=1 Tax=unclassified Nonomuraea TaxID=2593643 RepID=UPI00148603AE|nr:MULTISPECIES: hypothetical protein [unclassified Nonomuraea]
MHDWDSLAWQPEVALVGAARGSFASTGPPTLAPVAGHLTGADPSTGGSQSRDDNRRTWWTRCALPPRTATRAGAGRMRRWSLPSRLPWVIVPAS